MLRWPSAFVGIRRDRAGHRFRDFLDPGLDAGQRRRQGLGGWNARELQTGCITSCVRLLHDGSRHIGPRAGRRSCLAVSSSTHASDWVRTDFRMA